MSIDSSLKTSGGLVKHRNVLTRTERIARLAERGKFDMEGSDPMGLPKVGNRKVNLSGKSKKKDADEESTDGEVAAVAS
jgi:small basic protein (TIGR04137 family)